MMVRVVGILAVGLMSACGVGVEADDPEGNEAVTSRATLQLACAELGTCPEVPVAPRAPAPNPVAMPGTVGLPQDPIPWRPPVATERPFGPSNLPETGVPRR
ncbi:MAG: hypothetical protein IAE78_00900 [Myxococcus sp.]|nr:hypothetical protein [Myxococcus sp.]